MRKLILPFLICLTLIACSKEKASSALLGKWQLIEVAAAKPDASGTFESVQSEKTLTFKENGLISSNGNLCFYGTESDTYSAGVYETQDSLITSSHGNCNLINYRIQNGYLILSYNCIEGCASKWKKI